MCKERKNQLRRDTIARKMGKTPLLSDSQREDLTRRVMDDNHAIVTYFKRIEHHYDAYFECKKILERIGINKNKQESKHYIEELERYASTLAHQCVAFRGFSEGNYERFEKFLKRKKGKDLQEALNEIREKYGFKFHT